MADRELPQTRKSGGEDRGSETKDEDDECLKQCLEFMQHVVRAQGQEIEERLEAMRQGGVQIPESVRYLLKQLEMNRLQDPRLRNNKASISALKTERVGENIMVNPVGGMCEEVRGEKGEEVGGEKGGEVGGIEGGEVGGIEGGEVGGIEGGEVGGIEGGEVGGTEGGAVGGEEGGAVGGEEGGAVGGEEGGAVGGEEGGEVGGEEGGEVGADGMTSMERELKVLEKTVLMLEEKNMKLLEEAEELTHMAQLNDMRLTMRVPVGPYLLGQRGGRSNTSSQETQNSPSVSRRSRVAAMRREILQLRSHQY